MKKDETFSKQTVLNEISGKNVAIHAYDKIIWQVRTGFLSLTFGGWTFIIKGAIENGKTILQTSDFFYIMIAISIVLGISGFLIDRNYIRRKFRVINSLSILQELLINNEIDFENIKDTDRLKIIPHIKIVGDSGNKNYKGVGYKQELTVSYLIFSTVMLGCLCLLIYLLNN